jgi:putative oxidoreductase
MRNVLLLRFLRVFAPLGWAIVRFVAGGMLAMHGWHKLQDGPAKFAEGLAKMGAPMPEAAAWLSTFGELVGGGLLAIGLFTRPAGLVVAINMTVALLLAHEEDLQNAASLIGTAEGGRLEYPLLLLAVGICALFQGGGPVSFDRVTVERSVPPPLPRPPGPPPPPPPLGVRR